MKINEKVKNDNISSIENPFKIISDFKESGDQPSAINSLVKNIKNGENEHSVTQKQELQQQNPVVVLFPQIYPLLKQIAEKWIRDADIIETMCNLLKQCVTTLMDGIRPFANDMGMLLVQCYEAIPHSCMLDLGI